MSAANKGDTYSYVNDDMDRNKHDSGYVALDLSQLGNNTLQADEMYASLDQNNMEQHQYEKLQKFQT